MMTMVAITKLENWIIASIRLLYCIECGMWCSRLQPDKSEVMAIQFKMVAL